jgi:hypothetical protein
MDDIGISGNALIPEFETDRCKTGVAGLPRDGRQPSFSRVAMSNSQKRGRHHEHQFKNYQRRHKARAKRESRYEN